jgi:hypothetical protein
VSDDGKVILFPTDRIKNKENTGVQPSTKFQKQIEKEQTAKFIESAVDDIAMKLLHNFVDLAMKTQTDTFTKDFSYLVDCLRATIKRDFGLNHIVHKIVDNTVELNTDNAGNVRARIDYSNINDIDFRPKKDRVTKPLSEDVKDELTGVDFIPDFDPSDNDN